MRERSPVEPASEAENGQDARPSSGLFGAPVLASRSLTAHSAAPYLECVIDLDTTAEDAPVLALMNDFATSFGLQRDTKLALGSGGTDFARLKRSASFHGFYFIISDTTSLQGFL